MHIPKVFKIGNILSHLTIVAIDVTKKQNIIVQCDCSNKTIFAISEDNLVHKFKLHCNSLTCEHNVGNSIVFEKVKYILSIDSKIGNFMVIDVEKNDDGVRFFVLLCDCGKIIRAKKDQLVKRKYMCCGACALLRRAVQL